jgi:hypothetical protein
MPNLLPAPLVEEAAPRWLRRSPAPVVEEVALRPSRNPGAVVEALAPTTGG